MTRYSQPARFHSAEDGRTTGVIAYEEPTEFCTWDDETQSAVPIDPASLGCIIATSSDAPLVLLDQGEPYETPDGP